MKQIDLTPLYQAAIDIMMSNDVDEIRLRPLRGEDGQVNAIDFEVDGAGYLSMQSEFVPTIKAVREGLMGLAIRTASDHSKN